MSLLDVIVSCAACDTACQIGITTLASLSGLSSMLASACQAGEALLGRIEAVCRCHRCSLEYVLPDQVA